MKHILIINFSNLQTDSRVRRHVNLLKKNYQLTVACFDADFNNIYDVIFLKKQSLDFARKIKLSLLLGLRLFKEAHQLLYPHRYILKELSSKNFDLIIANDVEALPLAFDVAEQQKCKVILDAHEYAPRHFEDKFLWRTFFQPMNVYLCKKYIHRVARMITIGKGLANEYQKNFNVTPIVITNANYYHNLTPSKLIESKIRLVHHGIATPSRRLELMIEMIDHLDDRFTLDMYLLLSGAVSSKTKNYPDQLKALTANKPRVRILPPIKSDEIVTRINEYDMGVFLIPPINFNYENTLPNKLFDFIQARLAIAVGPTPEMAEIVNHFNLGVVSDDFSPKKLAEKLRQITPEQLRMYKQNAVAAASVLNAEKNEKILIELIESVLAQ